MTRYPITRHRDLRPLYRWGALRQRRRPLVAGPKETLVYQVGREYVTGSGDAAPARATAVTGVDTRTDVVLGAGYVLAAAGSPLDFQVTVFFRATVVNPAAVVRARHTEAIRDLDRFLAKYTSVDRLAGVHPPDDERGLEQAVAELLERWPTHGPYVPGMDVVAGGVHVLPATVLDIDA